MIDHPASFAQADLLVAERMVGERLGFAEFRRISPEAGFLSNICIDPRARGRRIAQRLIAEFVGKHNLDVLELDVFTSNEPARSLYRRLGFSETSRSSWWTAPIAESIRGRLLPVIDLHAALARHRVYGFTEIRGIREQREFRLGILGGTVLRCWSAQDFADTALHADARATFPDLREVFGVLPGNGTITVREDRRPPGAEMVLTTARMRAEAESILAGA